MNVKSLVLGSAAAIFAVTGAQAADLPVAEPVEYVRVCDTYGNGFFYIPGTETCLRIGGRVRAELRYLEPVRPATRTENHTFTRVRTYLRTDARTQTEYGLLRTYYDMWWTDNSGSGAVISNTIMWSGFIQFGGFTAGRTGSFFDYFVNYAGTWGSPSDVAYSVTRTNLFAYTFAFGNGLSFSVAAEDGTYSRTALSGVAAYGGHVMPDLTAALRIDQGWGNAQIAAKVHEIRATSATTATAEYGWAVMAGVKVNLPMIAAGDYLVLSGAYADGATSAVGGANGAWILAAGSVIDADTTATAINTTQAWSIQGSLVHNWTPQFSTGLSASYIDVDLPVSTAVADWNAWNILMVNAWTPVSGLVIGVEVGYENVDVSGVGSCAAVTGCDYDRWSGVFRVQRTW